jgi:two-component system response regulator MprA
MRVLVVEDELLVRESLALALRFEGYEVSVAGDGLDALISVRTERPDAVLLDVMMPRLDGFETCAQLRADGHAVPVLLLTAVDSAEGRARAVTAGADGYVVKPYDFGDVLSRLRDLLELHRAGPAELRFADFTLHLATRQLSRGARVVELAPLECRILEALFRQPSEPLSRSALFERVWGYDFGGESKILDAYLTTLRAKLSRLAAVGILQLTPSGYALEAQPPAA